MQSHSLIRNGSLIFVWILFQWKTSILLGSLSFSSFLFHSFSDQNYKSNKATTFFKRANQVYFLQRSLSLKVSRFLFDFFIFQSFFRASLIDIFKCPLDSQVFEFLLFKHLPAHEYPEQWIVSPSKPKSTKTLWPIALSV